MTKNHLCFEKVLIIKVNCPVVVKTLEFHYLSLGWIFSRLLFFNVSRKKINFGCSQLHWFCQVYTCTCKFLLCVVIMIWAWVVFIQTWWKGIMNITVLWYLILKSSILPYWINLTEHINLNKEKYWLLRFLFWNLICNCFIWCLLYFFIGVFGEHVYWIFQFSF